MEQGTDHTITFCFTAYQTSSFSVMRTSCNHIHPDCHDVTFQVRTWQPDGMSPRCISHQISESLDLIQAELDTRKKTDLSPADKLASRTSSDKLVVMSLMYPLQR